VEETPIPRMPPPPRDYGELELPFDPRPDPVISILGFGVIVCVFVLVAIAAAGIEGALS